MSKCDDHLDDNDIEALLARRSVAPDSGLADLTDVINEIGTTFTVLPEPASTERHLGAMFSAADALIASQGTLGSPALEPKRRKAMLKTLTASLAFKVGLGLGATALAATSGVALVNNFGDSSPKSTVVATDKSTDNERSLGAVLLTAASEAQDDYEAACQEQVRAFASKMTEAMNRFAAKHPDFAANMPDVTMGTPESACTVDWKTLVADTCASDASKHPAPPAGILEAMPEGLRPLITDPCNADWANVDWAGAMNDFDPAAMMRAACAAHSDGTPQMPEGDHEYSMGLGFEQFCASDFDFSAFTDFDWESMHDGETSPMFDGKMFDGKMPSADEIKKFKEQLGF
ncbi:MAG: hypothetical protein ACSLFB_12900 [Acidimicrobiales bacterium]